MRLQSFGVVFVLIVVPIILVLSYYVDLQVKTIINQNNYDKSLLAATYDAMSAFEINTANENLSTVSDSLRTIIEASCNVFTNTLTTNLGMSNASKSYIEPFIPAVLFTLYDGYYIYTPTKVPRVVTNSDGVALTVGDKGVRIGTGGNYIYEDGEESFIHHDNGSLNPEEYGQQLFYTRDTGDECTTDLSKAYITNKNVLKTYMPYSAQYKTSNINITVIYSLDNFVTIEGTIGDIYYTKCGYLISNTNKIEAVTDEPIFGTSTGNSDYGQVAAKEYIYSGNPIVLKLGSDVELKSGFGPLTVNRSDGSSVEEKTIPYVYCDSKDCTQLPDPVGGDAGSDNSPILTEDTINYNFYTYEGLQDRVQGLKNLYDKAQKYSKIGPVSSKDYTDFISAAEKEIPSGTSVEDFEELMRILTNKINERQTVLDTTSAIYYYVDSKIFTNWVTSELGGLQEKDIAKIGNDEFVLMSNKESSVLHDFSNSTAKVFDLTGTYTEDLGEFDVPLDSMFYSHKANVIRNSIQYNLNLSMAAYTEISSIGYDFKLPVLDDLEWDKILTNVSVTSFMQGYNCGLKAYNNYKIVSSTNNEISISPDEIFYVKASAYNKGDGLDTSVNSNDLVYHRINCPKLYEDGTSDTEYISFTSKEIKYDKYYDKNNLEYPYRYDHKNNACYDCIIDRNYKSDESKKNIFEGTDEKSKNLQKYYYLAVGKERNNLYKMNAFDNPGGFEIVKFGKDDGSGYSKKPLSEIRTIEITLNTPLKFSPEKSENTLYTNIKNNNTLLIHDKEDSDDPNNEFATYEINNSPKAPYHFYINIYPGITSSDTVTSASLSFYSKRHTNLLVNSANISAVTSIVINGTTYSEYEITDGLDIHCIKVIYK